MVDVQRVIACWQVTRSARATARHLGIDRKTVARYVAAARSLGVGSDRALTEGELAAVLTQSRAAPERPGWEALQAHRELLAPLVAEDPPSLRGVHQRLAERGVRVAYSTLRRFAQREIGWRGTRLA
jgi:hypothetical protein